MQSMKQITAIAARRKGGGAALERLLTRPLSPARIRKIPDDRWLSAMTKCVFQAGFNWQVIEDKWARFEEVFAGFDTHRWRMMSDDDLDRLLKEDGIVRNAAKLRSVRENAAFLDDMAEAHGSAGAYFATWQRGDYCRHLRELQKGGSRLGGKTGQIFLRRMGVDTLVFSDDVIKALQREGIVDRMPGSNKDWRSLQDAIDVWHGESGRTLNEISQILAFSVE
ncbi:MAG TPA: 3-methyladenine DNA glycosylase [Gammaproteobacteria bacterium]|nr:3-methyladenine DNA glycosylase [Gammaproteobacteria bacterium]